MPRDVSLTLMRRKQSITLSATECPKWNGSVEDKGTLHDFFYILYLRNFFLANFSIESLILTKNKKLLRNFLS